MAWDFFFIIISNSSIFLKEILHHHCGNATNSNQCLSTSERDLLWLDFQGMISWRQLHSRSVRCGRHSTPTHCSTVAWPTKEKVQSIGFPQLLFREERKLPSMEGLLWSPLGRLCIVVWWKINQNCTNFHCCGQVLSSAPTAALGRTKLLFLSALSAKLCKNYLIDEIIKPFRAK